MKTINFSDYNSTLGDSLALARLAADLNGARDVRVVFDKELYVAERDMAVERRLFVSNHGQYYPKRIAMLVENAENVELDFCGATLRAVGRMTNVVISNSKNVTVKNLVIENPQTCFMQAEVVAHGDNYVDLEVTHGDVPYRVRKGELTVYGFDFQVIPAWSYIEIDNEIGERAHGAGGENTMGDPLALKWEKLEDGKLRMNGVTRKAKIGSSLIINLANRHGSGIFCEDSSDITIENVTVHSCYGMGFLAQLCDNVHLNNFRTERHGTQLYTSNADATHFVNCTGEILVENCLFEGQLDDALNIHGFYTSIIAKDGRDIYVKEMHEQALGLKIYKPGDCIKVMPRDTLLPYAERKIVAVEYLNMEVIRLTLDESADGLEVGHAVENVSHVANLTFRKNVVRDNRARSMLIAAKGRVVIEDNYFHAPSRGIYFESDGQYWYESGSTTDVVIRGNHFDRCSYGVYGMACICGKPRERVVDGEYFHNKLLVTGNRFTMEPEFRCVAAIFDNFTEVDFVDNVIEGETEIQIQHVGKYDVQSDVPVTVVQE